MTTEHELSLGVQDRLNITENRREQIISYIKMASKGPEDLCDLLKEVPLNFKGNEKYFSIYIISLFIVHHSDRLKKEKRDTFLDDMWYVAAECFSLDLDNLLGILSGSN